MDETYLWPTAGESSRSQALLQAELVELHRDRASVPRDVWLSLLSSARECIDVLVFSGTFMAQTNPQVAAMLRERAEAGVRVRLCFGDPQGEAVAIRGKDEGIGDALAAKIRASLTYYRGLPDVVDCEVRLHDTTLYNSIFRYDDNMMINPHIWGQPASANPVLQLQRLDATGWFDQYLGSFEAVWETASPWTGNV
ncbi:XRE family transcriptional regulator [Streptomyces sparsogenes]|uniref:XRE family transcriptional regulator n=1 Tax=Streptomyces sparsogenes TaxID=67365 RepID=UPI0033E86ADB